MRITEVFPTRREDVIWRRMGDESVLLSVKSENYYSLDEVGTRIWELLDGQSTAREIAIKISEEYDVLPEEAEADIAALIQELRQQELLD